MNRRSWCAAAALSLVAVGFGGHAWAGAGSLELFGTPLKGAQRDQLRKVFQGSELRSVREDDSYWVDIYDATRALDGASQFQVGYVSASGKFAYAQYTFPGFMKMELVGQVIDMVSSKYGKPGSVKGSYNLGNVSAKWAMAQGMEIEVHRGWPDTTTFLTFRDKAAHKQMQAEIIQAEQAQTRQKAQAQSRAF